jgi:diguanylate cyclase
MRATCARFDTSSGIRAIYRRRLGHRQEFVGDPVNSVKLDRSFIAEIQNGPRQAALAEAIVKVGQALHLTVVAEGIETAEQLDWLRAMDCEYGQGYYFARPQDPAIIDADLARLSVGVR